MTSLLRLLVHAGRITRGGPVPGVAALAFLLLAGCGGGESLAPRGVPPYLAIVAKQLGRDVPARPGQYGYRVRDLSTEKYLDTLIIAQPRDTLILSVKPSTYQVELVGLPGECRSRYGTTEAIQVPPGSNTALIRFYLVCNPSLVVTVATVGVQQDSAFIYDLTGPAGLVERGVLGANDSLAFSALAPGDYAVTLAHLRSNCTFTNTGGDTQPVRIDSLVNARLEFYAVCSQPDARPTVLSFRPSYHDGAGVFVARAADPNRDMRNYFWDLTDCAGRSVLPGGTRSRGYLDAGRTAGLDTITIIGGFELGLPDSAMAGKCATLRIEDGAGNTSDLVEAPLRDAPSARPIVGSFNAVLNGATELRATLSASDAQGDLLGVFLTARLRDGTLGPANGQDDFGIYNTAGFLGTGLPALPLTGRITYQDVYGLIAYVVDEAGNFTRVEDDDTFQ